MEEVDGTAPGTRSDAGWDLLAEQLQAVRMEVGEPSYAEIARRISENRLSRGASPHAARVARTTVYDAFRAGRARVNLGLVREIALALGADDARVDEWVARSRARSRPGAPQPQPLPAPPSATSEIAPEAALPQAPPAGQPAARRGARAVLALMAVCVALNVTGRVLVEFLNLPVHLDMVGTAVAAIALGPWLGAAVGAATNLLAAASSGLSSLPFGLVNVAGALLWGYGVRRWGLGRTLPRFLALNLGVALACSLLAAPILLLAFDGSTGHGQDVSTRTLLALIDSQPVAVGLSNLLSSLGDKTISGFLALVAVSALPLALRPAWQLPFVTADATPPAGPAGRLPRPRRDGD